MKHDLTVDLIATMFAVSRLMREEMSFSNKFTHLSVQQIQTLVFLKTNKKTTMSDVAAYFHVELPTATSLVNKLCEMKLIMRREDKKDRRLVLLTLTRAGKRLMEHILTNRRKKITRLLSYLTVGEKEQLYRILKTLETKLHHS